MPSWPPKLINSRPFSPEVSEMSRRIQEVTGKDFLLAAGALACWHFQRHLTAEEVVERARERLVSGRERAPNPQVRRP